MTKRSARLLCRAVVLLFAAGCSDLGSTDFTIPVDSVSGPLKVTAQSALTQFLYGPVGPDLCSWVKSVDVTRTATGADITVIGTRRGGNCQQMPAYMVAEPVTVSPPFPSPLLLRVRSAGGAWLERTVQVE